MVDALIWACISPLRIGRFEHVVFLVASRASLSASSLPVTPTWLGTQQSWKHFFASYILSFIRFTIGFLEYVFSIACIELLESVIIVTSLLFARFFNFCTANNIA